jgi:hypothetical protein
MAIMNQIKKLFGRTLQTANPTWSSERESPRYNITMFARYQGEGPFIERRGNIGIGGFCFEGEKEYLPGTPVDLLFRLPGTQTWIHARGRVLGTSDNHGYLGVRGHFTSIGFDDERMLARWIDSMTLQLQAAAA